MVEARWVVAKSEDGLSFECTRCEGTYEPTLPASITMVAAMSKQFLEDHANCPGLLERIDQARTKFEIDAKTEGFDKARWLGKEGELTKLMQKMGSIPADERSVAGEALNRLTARIKAA